MKQREAKDLEENPSGVDEFQKLKHFNNQKNPLIEYKDDMVKSEIILIKRKRQNKKQVK
jgi:hypothetical protein